MHYVPFFFFLLASRLHTGGRGLISGHIAAALMTIHILHFGMQCSVMLALTPPVQVRYIPFNSILVVLDSCIIFIRQALSNYLIIYRGTRGLAGSWSNTISVHPPPVGSHPPDAPQVSEHDLESSVRLSGDTATAPSVVEIELKVVN